MWNRIFRGAVLVSIAFAVLHLICCCLIEWARRISSEPEIDLFYTFIDYPLMVLSDADVLPSVLVEYAWTPAPGQPYWGLIIMGTAFYAVCGGVLGAVLVTIMSRSLRRRREKHGLCGGCGYDLRGNVSGLCPECGTITTKSEILFRKQSVEAHTGLRLRRMWCSSIRGAVIMGSMFATLHLVCAGLIEWFLRQQADEASSWYLALEFPLLVMRDTEIMPSILEKVWEPVPRPGQLCWGNLIIGTVFYGASGAVLGGVLFPMMRHFRRKRRDKTSGVRSVNLLRSKPG